MTYFVVSKWVIIMYLRQFRMSKNGAGKMGILLFIAILFTSCGNFENINIGEPNEFTVKGFEENHLLVNVNVPVENPTIHKIKIKELDIRVFLNGRYIGKLFIDENIVIKGKESRIYELPVKVRLNNLLGAAFIMMNLKKGQRVDVKFEGTVTGKTLIFKKVVEIDESTSFVI